MIPTAFVMLEAFPRTLNGKVDRRALPAPERSRPLLDVPYVAPRTPIEETLAAMWAEVLHLEQVGIHDPFLDLGGHSLLATQILTRIITTFRVELPLRTLLDAPTVAEMAIIIAQHQAAQGDPQTIARLLAEVEAIAEHDA
jgi:acyl carrier protein